MHAADRTSKSHSANGSKSVFSIKLGIILITCCVTFAVTLAGSRRVFISKASVNALQNGADIYSRSCARCHGPDGRAKTAKGKAVGAADLTSDDWQPDPARDLRIITNGKSDMPAFKRSLKAAEIQAVATYIRRFKR